MSPPRSRLGAGDRRHRAEWRTARRPGQCRRHRRHRHRRGHRLRDLAPRSWRSISTARFSAANTSMRLLRTRRRFDRQHLVGLRPGRRTQSRGLQCLEGRRTASDQIGRASSGARHNPPVRCNSVHPAFIEGPMADGMIAQFRDPAPRPRTASPLPSRSAASARPPRSPSSASICSPTNPPSSPAPNSCSTAASLHSEALLPLQRVRGKERIAKWRVANGERGLNGV